MTTAHLHRLLVIAKDGNLDDIFVIPCNCIDTNMALHLHSLAIEYWRQRDLCTLVIILHSIHTIQPWCISWHQLVCHKVVIAYTIAILVREVLHEKRAQK